MSSCPDCGVGANPDIDPYLDHCHGTLILHTDRTVECTDAACELADLLRHAFLVDCAALGGCCAAAEPAELPAAS